MVSPGESWVPARDYLLGVVVVIRAIPLLTGNTCRNFYPAQFVAVPDAASAVGRVSTRTGVSVPVVLSGGLCETKKPAVRLEDTHAG